MCLYTKMIMPIKAHKSIVVYKVLKKKTYGYETPCMGVRAALGKYLLANDGFVKHKLTSYKAAGAYLRVVGICYVHAFTTLKNAILAAEAQRKGDFSICVVECIIEPGTLYFKSCDKKQICARSLFISENVVFEI